MHSIFLLGLDFRFKDLTIEDIKLKLKIWDTAGQEKYRAITVNSYKGASGAILVFDLTDKSTLNNIQHWMRQLKNHVGENIPKLLLGNKCDMDVNVSRSEIDDVCKEFGLVYFETSAKLNRNIAESFMHIAKEIVTVAKSENINGNGGNSDGRTLKDYQKAPKMGVKLDKDQSYDNNDNSLKCQC